MGSILVIDLGTTYFKVSLFGDAGQLRGLVSVAVPIETGSSGRCELDAARFWQSVTGAVRRLADEQAGGLADVEAVTFATQTNSFVLLDGADQPLTPLILWPDRRAVEGEEAMREWSGRAGFAAQTGIPCASHQFMAAKLHWLRRAEPDVWRRVRRLCLISDYLTLRLTGRHVTEAGTAGLTGLIDIHRLRFRDEALSRFELERAWLPAVVRAGTDWGPLPARVAGEWGLPAGCRFVVGCLDQYAGAIGAGACSAAAIAETTGTVLATVRCCDRFTPQPAPIFQGPAFAPGLYYQMVFGDVSANYLEWYRRQLPETPGFDELTALAATVAPGADGLRLRTDVPLTAPAAVFDGVGAAHTRGHFVRCILEAVAQALRDQVTRLVGYIKRSADVPSDGDEQAAARNGRYIGAALDVPYVSRPESTPNDLEPLAAGAGRLGRSQCEVPLGPESTPHGSKPPVNGLRHLAGSTQPDVIRCVGGAARSALWLQIKADMLGVPVAATRCPEATSLGAAILAAATLHGRTVAEVSRQWVQLGRVYHPDPGRQRRYEALFPGASSTLLDGACQNRP